MKPDPADRTPPRTVRTAKAKFSEVVAVCAKCAKRQGLSKRAIRDQVKTGLKRSGSGEKLRVVETGCLGPCPKRLVAVATGTSVAAGRILLVDPTASPDAMVALLLPPRANLGQDDREDDRDDDRDAAA